MVLAAARQYFRLHDHGRVRTDCAGFPRETEKEKKRKKRLIRTSFLVYPSAFVGSTGHSVNESVASVVAIVLLALGYAVSVTLWFLCSSWFFQLDVIFLYVSIKFGDGAPANLT